MSSTTQQPIKEQKIKTQSQIECNPHKDAKWICGILLVFFLTITLSAFNLMEITAEKNAVDATTMIIATSFSQNGLDDKKEIEQFHKKFQASHLKSIQPIPGLNLTITEKDFENSTPKELRLKLFRQITEPLYREGIDGFTALGTTKEMKKNLSEGAGPIGWITLKTHQQIVKILIVLAGISLIFFILLIKFSRGLGRLISPGVVLIITSLPATIFFFFIYTVLQHPRSVNEISSTQGSMQGTLETIAINVMPPIISIMLKNYIIFLILGLALIFGACFGKIIQKIRPS